MCHWEEVQRLFLLGAPGGGLLCYFFSMLNQITDQLKKERKLDWGGGCDSGLYSPGKLADVETRG